MVEPDESLRGRVRSSPGRRGLLGAVLATVAASAAGCLSSGGAEGTTTLPPSNGVVVGPDGEYSFAPASIEVAVGETVTWTWDSDSHNVVVADQPADADWRGTEGDASTTYDAGHRYAYTFEVPGTYGYYCNPHRGLGMEAEVVVTDG